MTPSWGSINFLTELRKAVSFLHHWRIPKGIKDMNEQPDEGYTGQGLEGSGTQELLALWIGGWCVGVILSTNQKVSKP